MQKGFASLEIILAVPVIALLATVAVPNVARALNCEQKRRRLRFTTRRIIRSSKGGFVMQKGFASLEIILAVLIIALLATVAVSNVARALNCEQKRRRLRFTTRRIIRSSKGGFVMQKGFASLEIILAVLIIALLATVAIPNAARFVDRAAVDYEQKRLYSELQFLHTFDRTAMVDSTGTSLADFVSSKMTVESFATLNIDRDANSYQIFRTEKPLREPHNLSYGVTFSNETNVPNLILFDSTGKAKFSPATNNSVTIVLKSRRGHKLKIIFDSVGRIRAGK